MQNYILLLKFLNISIMNTIYRNLLTRLQHLRVFTPNLMFRGGSYYNFVIKLYL